MRIVNIHEAKPHFSKLIDAVNLDEEIIIAKAGKPAARLLPWSLAKQDRKPGSQAGKIKIADDFDAPLPPDLQAAFEGR